MDRDETGQMSVMIIGFVLVLLMAIAAITDASAAYLQHSGLDTVADGAALAGADALDEPLAYAAGVAETPALAPDLAQARIRDYVRDTGAQRRFPGLTVRSRIIDNEVVVEVTAPLDLPLHLPGAAHGTPITSIGAARLDPSD